MTNHLPAYLKLHEAAPQGPIEPTDELLVLAEAMETAIGWQVTVCQQRGADEDSFATPLSVGEAQATEPLIPREAAESVVTAMNQVCGELRRTRRALWQREAELAAAVPVTPRLDEESHLAERLEAILQGGAEAVGANAAALYVLNDDTTELKVRACWGLPQKRLLDPARPLRGAVADLEALIGHAVVLEDTSLLPHWKVPEEGYPTAMCVPVSSPTAPLGTLWLFSNEPRDFTPEQTNLVEIVAGRLASDLDREVLMHEGLNGQDLRKQRDIVASTQFDRLPTITPILDDWDLAGWTTPSGDVLGDFFDWTVLPDGQLALAIGDAMGHGLESALTASNLQTALKAHSCYRHDSRQMIARLNETLWTSSAGDQFASMFYCLIDPESGQLQYTTSGKVSAIASHFSAPLIGGALPLGTQPEDTFRLESDCLPQGGSLVMVSEGLLPLVQPRGRRRCELAQLLEDAADARAEQIAEAVRALMLAKLSPIKRDCTVLVVKRT